MGNGKNKRRQRMTKAPFQGAEKNTLKQEPLIVSLQLRFIDPEGTIRFFPKGFETEVVYGENAKKETRKIDNDEGHLIFRLSRDEAYKHKFFRLNFASGEHNHIICEKKGEDKKATLGNRPLADEKGKQGQRFFRLPSRWSFLNSDWVVSFGREKDDTDKPLGKSELVKVYDDAEKQKKFLLTENNKPRSVGSREHPIKTLLNPHWQYLRFEFFDRYFGHSDHDNKPVSIPQITVEGSRRAKSGNVDTRSNWRVVKDVEEQAVQCLPWIIQAKDDGTKEPKPDDDVLLQFKQPEDTYIISKSATERNIKSLVAPIEKEDDDSLKPCANRLKYYDLPEVWKSQKYWCRLSNDQYEKGFFENMVYQKTMLQKPLIFSLDDIILTDDQIAPISMRETDKIVLFYHEFLDPTSDAARRGTGGRDGATYYKNGLYKPGLDLVAGKKKASDDAKAAKKAQFDAKAPTAETKEETDVRNDAKGGMSEEDAIFLNMGDVDDGVIHELVRGPGDKAVIELTGKNAAILADAPLQAKLKAEAKQRAIEEKPIRETAEANRRKKEEDAARQEAEDAVLDSGGTNEAALKAGAKAVADLGKNEEAQKRIKDAGNNAVTGALPKNAAAQKRIKDAGEEAAEAARVFPYSDIPRHEEVPNYISEYPHWTRLVVFGGNLFEVFDKRTDKGDVIGARAAVRLVDATSSGVGVAAGSEINPRPTVSPAKAQQDEIFFILQPYLEQQFFVRSSSGSSGSNRPQGFYDEWNSPIAANDAKVFKNTRFDIALLRDSNFKDTNEETVVFRYHRLSFDFTAKTSDLNPAGAAPADIEDQRIKWTTTFTTTCADRWNGNDTVNDSRTWIIEDKDADPRLRSQVITFVQRVDKSKAHFHVDTVAETGGGGSWMAADDGTGQLRVKAGADSANRGFAAAHEIGHSGGQPDDYAPDEYGVVGFGSNHVQGAPFVLDENAMMFYNKQIRSRSFWYVTEWLRGLNPFTDKKFKIEHAGFTYKIPHYNHNDRPGRNYTHWAVKGNIFYKPGTPPVYYDAFLYFLGQDEYSSNILTSQPDGIIVVMLKSLFAFNDYTDDDDIKEHVLSRLYQKINNALNNPRVHARFSLAGIDRGTPDTFMKCLLHFSPRFEVGTGLPAHLKVTIKEPVVGAVKQWFYSTDGVSGTGPFTEMQMHGKFNSNVVKDDTKLISRVGATWDPAGLKNATSWNEFEAAFTTNSNPRKLDFRFPPDPGSVGGLNPVVTRLENVFFKHFCQMLGLSTVSTQANYYGNADAYKDIVKACLNDNALNPTMSRP
jgi:hypothetical protein